MKRRHFLIGASALGATTALALKPTNNGMPYSPYFRNINEEFSKRGPYKPALFIDLTLLDRNITTLLSTIDKAKNYRIVAKSLPSPSLLDYIMRKTNTQRLMVFHLPFLQQVARDFPQSDILLGKPMPVGAAKHFYQTLSEESAFDSTEQLQWLIDTPARLQQYEELAKTLNRKLRINIEIDVGLHRGGLTKTQDLTKMLDLIISNPSHLTFSGLMGYDPHVVKLPPIIKSEKQAYSESQAEYQKFITTISNTYPSLDINSLCLNGAGSPTLELHRNNSVINDVSAGSCLVKPSDFDIPSLENFIPAAYIATPILKKLSGTKLPSVEQISPLMEWWDPNQQQTLFIYGGQWMANYESPKGLQKNSLYGRSTNQQIVNSSLDTQLDIDDYVFLRPTQSESVFLQFEEIIAIRDGIIQHHWPILRNT